MTQSIRIFIAGPLLAFSAFANAGACTALDYQEMKDMSDEDLSVVTCQYRITMNAAFSDAIADIGRPRGAQANTTHDAVREECSGQLDRIARVLKLKGVTEETVQLHCAAKEAERKERVERLKKLRG